jgi:hypothetical protein
VVTPAHTAAVVLAESAQHQSEGMAAWVVAVITFGSILVLGVVLSLMTRIERKRHPHL